MIIFGNAFVNNGIRPVVAKEGPKWTQVVYHDGSEVKVKKVRGKISCQPLYGCKGYTLRMIATRFLRRKNAIGGKVTISKAAKKILLEAKEIRT